MILCIDWLLNIGLVQAFTIDDQVILILLDTNWQILIEQFILLMGLKTVILIISWSPNIRSKVR